LDDGASLIGCGEVAFQQQMGLVELVGVGGIVQLAQFRAVHLIELLARDGLRSGDGLCGGWRRLGLEPAAIRQHQQQRENQAVTGHDA